MGERIWEVEDVLVDIYIGFFGLFSVCDFFFFWFVRFGLVYGLLLLGGVLVWCVL